MMLAVMVSASTSAVQWDCPCEDVGQPVVDVAWKVELGQLLHQDSVPDCVKCLAGVYSEMMMTYGWVSNRFVSVLKRNIIEAERKTY
jgi:hypothetical protein